MVTISGGQVIAERWGQAPSRVVALHGWGRTHADWRPSLGHMDTTSVDFPGFGQSRPPSSPQGSRWYAQQVAPLLDDGPKVLVGHSFGGRVAVHLAQMRPQDVQAIVLTGAPLVRTTTPPKPKLAVRAVKFLNKRGIIPDSLVEAQKQKHGSADYRAAQGVMREVLVKVLHENYDEQLRALKCPLSLVYGELDTAAPPAVAHAIKARCDHASVEIVPGQGHALSGPLGDRIEAAVQGYLD